MINKVKSSLEKHLLSNKMKFCHHCTHTLEFENGTNNTQTSINLQCSSKSSGMMELMNGEVFNGMEITEKMVN